MTTNKKIVECFTAARKLIWDGISYRGNNAPTSYICVAIEKTNFDFQIKDTCVDIVDAFVGWCEHTESPRTVYGWYKAKHGYINHDSLELQNVRFKIVDDFIKKYSEEK